MGIERQAKRWFKGGIATIIPVPTFLSDGETIDKVQASYADYVWGVPGEWDPAFPSLGLATVSAPDGRRRILQVEDDSLGAKAGFAVGDIIVSVDGRAVADFETLNVLFAQKRWGDAITVGVSRGGTDMTMRVPLRRSADPSKR